jgi:hypothetical protein
MTVRRCCIYGEMDGGIPYVGWLETKPIWHKMFFLKIWIKLLRSSPYPFRIRPMINFKCDVVCILGMSSIVVDGEILLSWSSLNWLFLDCFLLLTGLHFKFEVVEVVTQCQVCVTQLVRQSNWLPRVTCVAFFFFFFNFDISLCLLSINR